MIKGLEALENIKIDMEYVTRLDFVEPIVRGEVQQSLYKIYHRETPELETIEKELRAFDIIKEKQVDVRMFIVYDLENYNKLQKNDYCKLTKAEDDLLKEVLL